MEQAILYYRSTIYCIASKILYISCRESIIRKKTFLSFDLTPELNTKVKVRGMSFTLMIREELYYMITLRFDIFSPITGGCSEGLGVV